jgi:CheY-like chemotaxis protein/HPt (histidine-containing phosphotransfer) domain-containing protein
LLSLSTFNRVINTKLKLPAHAYHVLGAPVLLALLPPAGYLGLQWLADKSSLPVIWTLLIPWLGAALTLAGLCLYAYNFMSREFWQPLREQRNHLAELANDLEMAQARRAAAQHYVDRLNAHLEQARANSAALSKSLNESRTRQEVVAQTHHRLIALARQNLQLLSGPIITAGQPESGWQGNINTAELQQMQTAQGACDFYLTELLAQPTDLPSADISTNNSTTSHSKINDAAQAQHPESLIAHAPNSTYILRSCVLDAITLLQPYLSMSEGDAEFEIWPVYKSSVPVEFYGDKALIRSTVFHYLLAMLQAENAPNKGLEHGTSLSSILHIQYTKTTHLNAQLEFRLETKDNSDPPEQPMRWNHNLQPRLSQLLSNLLSNQGGHLPHSGIYLTAQPTNTVPERGHGLTAKIYPRDGHQDIGLQSCLRDLDIEITEDNTADLCIIGLTSDSAVSVITDQLDKQTTVILLNNARIYQKAGWHVLPTPLHYQTLVDCIHQQSVRQRQAKILVVDDDKSARLFLCTLLREYGATVLEAADGLTALATAIAEPIDLIFMDIHMPRMNGLEATRQLRASLDNPLPIIALTAHVIDSERAAIIDAGMNATLIKPVDLLTLRQTLHQWLNAGRNEKNTRGEIPISIIPMSIIPVFDTHLALKIANQRPQLAIEMLALFMLSLDADQNHLRHAHGDGDLEQFTLQIHRLNGAARFCGIPRIQILLHDMETQLKAHGEKFDFGELSDTAQQLHFELNALRDWYQTTANPLATEVVTTR